MAKKIEVAVIGLGSMGYGIAQSCLRAGQTTYGFDVVPDQMERFCAEGGTKAHLHDIAATLDTAIVVVLNAAQTEEVLFGDGGLVPLMRAGSVVIACATVPPDFARDMEARCTALGIHYLDAPISGGAAKAASGQLAVMSSGTP